jgi:hypothetical protein
VLERKVTHDGDARLARHVAHAALRTDNRGSRIVKDQTQARAASTSRSSPSWRTTAPGITPSSRARRIYVLS